MSDALSFPPRPNLAQYKKLARDLQQACQSSDSGAVRLFTGAWMTLTFEYSVAIAWIGAGLPFRKPSNSAGWNAYT